jgi:hypothetical protein
MQAYRTDVLDPDVEARAKELAVIKLMRDLVLV